MPAQVLPQLPETLLGLSGGDECDAEIVPDLGIIRLEANGRRQLLDDGERSAHLGEGWRFHFSEGHTPGQMLPEIAMPDGPVVFSGDLIPGAPWVHLPLTMGYDRFPEGLGPVLAVGSLVGLVLVEPDFATAAFLAGLAVLLFVLAGIPWPRLLGMGLAVALVVLPFSGLYLADRKSVV